MTGTYENGIYREGDVRLSDLSGRRRLPIGRDGLDVYKRQVYLDGRAIAEMPTAEVARRRCV